MNVETVQTNKPLNKWSRKELLDLPSREWGEVSEYDSVLILSTNHKHDSGWSMMAIIGIRDANPVEIACQHCDDIEWRLPPMLTLGGGTVSIGQMRMDCPLRSGAVHTHGRDIKFKVGLALSSTTIEVIAK